MIVTGGNIDVNNKLEKSYDTWKYMLNDLIIKKMREKGEGFRCSDLSRKTNIPHETLRRIIEGTTPNPSLNTVAKIAQALNTSLDELAEIPPYTSYKTRIDNPSLFVKTATFVLKKAKSSSNDTLCSGFLKCVFDIYNYSKHQEDIDIKFAEWCIKTHLMEGR